MFYFYLRIIIKNKHTKNGQGSRGSYRTIKAKPQVENTRPATSGIRGHGPLSWFQWKNRKKIESRQRILQCKKEKTLQVIYLENIGGRETWEGSH